MKEGGGSRGSNDDACLPDALKLNGAWGSFHRGHSPVPGRTNGPQGPVAICCKALPSLGIVFTDGFYISWSLTVAGLTQL